MRKLIPILLCCSVSGVAFADMELIGDPVAGQAKATNCVACHSADGNSVVPMWPKIAGQHPEYAAEQMMLMREGPESDRFEPTMYEFVMNLTDQDIADLVAYFSEQEVSPGAAKEDLVELGQQIYRGGNLETGVPACIACHGPNGEGNALANFPRVSSQHAEYTAKTLNDYKSGKRKSDPNGMMPDITMKMTEAEIQAVASYIEGLY